MKLISMTDFVQEQISKISKQDTSGYLHQILSEYANFLKQDLTLGMFVPCDEEGNVLEEKDFYQKGVNRDEHTSYMKALKQYQQAKERVLFEGYEYGNETSDVWQIYLDLSINLETNLDRLIFTKKTGKCLDAEFVENLVSIGLTLTKSAQKQIGL